MAAQDDKTEDGEEGGGFMFSPPEVLITKSPRGHQIPAIFLIKEEPWTWTCGSLIMVTLGAFHDSLWDHQDRNFFWFVPKCFPFPPAEK